MSSLRSSIVGALLLLSACIAWTAPAQAPAANAPVPQQRELDLRARPWKGDFESTCMSSTAGSSACVEAAVQTSHEHDHRSSEEIIAKMRLNEAARSAV